MKLLLHFLICCPLLCPILNAQTLVKGGFATSSLGNPRALTNVNGTLFFIVDDGINGTELWKSDGTTIGTTMVKDITTGSLSTNFGYEKFTGLNSEIFFSINDPSVGVELWKSDGTASGTGIVKDINPGVSGSNVSTLIKSNNNLFFAATNVTSGEELWKTDGTTSGTVLVKDIYSGTIGSFPDFLCDVNGTVFFSAYTAGSGTELWKSDGTAAGTVLVKDINPGTGASSPMYLINVNGTLYFFAYSTANGRELWKSDGTAAGTVLVKDINPGTASSEPGSLSGNDCLVNGNGTLYFYATDGTTGLELWKSDGTAAGTSLVKDINTGSNTSVSAGTNCPWMRYSNGMLYFQASNGINGQELWKSDGTTTGTMMVKDICSGSNSSAPRYITIISNISYFMAMQSNFTYQLFRSDGSSAGTYSLNIPTCSNSPNPTNLTNVNGVLFFRAGECVNDLGLWKLDPNSVTSLSYNYSSDLQLSIFPNPTNAKFTVETQNNETILITNILGETILTQQLQQGKNEIDLGKQSNGIYFIKTNDATYKIIKQ